MTQEQKVNRAALYVALKRVLPPRAARAVAKNRLYEDSPLKKERDKNNSFESGDESDLEYNRYFPK